MDTPEILYHYTDAKGLYGILDSKQIWASSYRFMSDSREFEYGFDLISELFPENSPYSRFAELIKSWKSAYEYDVLFVASFSAVDDSLGQWRGYAGLHSGYSLGFCADDLKSINSETRLMDCCYDKQNQLLKLTKLIDRYLPDARTAMSSTAPNANDLLLLATHAAQDMVVLSPKFKHPAFKEEKEWRLVVGPLTVSNKSICHRADERVIIPYVKIDFCTTGFPLKEIIVGPGPHQQRSVRSLHQMLAVKKIIGAKVMPSKVPFRTW